MPTPVTITGDAKPVFSSVWLRLLTPCGGSGSGAYPGSGASSGECDCLGISPSSARVKRQFMCLLGSQEPSEAHRIWGCPVGRRDGRGSCVWCAPGGAADAARGGKGTFQIRRSQPCAPPPRRLVPGSTFPTSPGLPWRQNGAPQESGHHPVEGSTPNGVSKGTVPTCWSRRSGTRFGGRWHSSSLLLITLPGIGLCLCSTCCAPPCLGQEHPASAGLW